MISNILKLERLSIIVLSKLFIFVSCLFNLFDISLFSEVKTFEELLSKEVLHILDCRLSYLIILVIF